MSLVAHGECLAARAAFVGLVTCLVMANASDAEPQSGKMLLIDGRADSVVRGALRISAELTASPDSSEAFLVRARVINARRRTVPVAYACFSLNVEFRASSETNEGERVVLRWRPNTDTDAEGRPQVPCPTVLFLEELAPGDTLQPPQFIGRAGARDSALAELPPGAYTVVLQLCVEEGTNPRVLEKPVALRLGKVLVK